MPENRQERSVLRSVNALAVLEWTAFFAAYIVMGVYLVEVAGFDDVGAGWAAGAFGMGLCVLPSFAGAVADRAGYRRTLLGSYGLQAAGFGILAVARSPLPAILGLGLVAVGGAASRAVLLGTVGITSPSRRTRAYSVMMQAINAGCFLGKMVARPLRLDFGLASVDAFAAAAFLAVVALAFVVFRPPAETRPRDGGRAGSLETLRGMARVLSDRPFLAMIVQVGLFWAVQGQMYATMPRYALRLAGPAASPEWYAMVNPAVVIALILPVNRLTRDWSYGRTVVLAFPTLAVATVLMGLGPWLVTLSGGTWHLAGLEVSPMTAAFVTASGLSGLAECFLVPRFLDRIAALAPPGQAALFQGYGYLNGVVSSLAGWGLSGYLIERWCPDPQSTPGAVDALGRAAAGRGPWPEPWSNGPFIFLAWAGVALLALGLSAAARPRSSRAPTRRPLP